MAIFIKEEALRALVREALDGTRPAQTQGPDDAVKVNDVVDPQAAATDSSDRDFRPQNAIELKAAVEHIVDTVPDEKAAEVYGKLKKIGDTSSDSYASSSSTQVNDDGKAKMTKSHDNKVEETIRRAIRLQLVEQINGSSVTEAEDDDEGENTSKKRRGAYKDTALGHMGDEGTNFTKIAKDLGFSVSGAKQAVDKAIRKTQFLQTKIDPDDLEVLILTAMNDYINYLAGAKQSSTKQAGVDPAEWEKEIAKYRDEMAELGLEPDGETGEISDEDIQLMKDHPDIVRTLPGFRDFLHNYIRRAAKEMGEKIS